MVDQAANDTGVDIFNEFAVTDEGVWIPFKGDVEFLIARMGNPKYSRRLGYFYDKYKRMLDGKDEAAEKKSREVMAQVMAETILLGWKGDVRFEGKKVDYSVATATKLLMLDTFRAWVSKHAGDEQAHKLVQDKVDEENL